MCDLRNISSATSSQALISDVSMDLRSKERADSMALVIDEPLPGS